MWSIEIQFLNNANYLIFNFYYVFLMDHFQIDIVSTLIYLMAAKLEKSGRGKKK